MLYEGHLTISTKNLHDTGIPIAYSHHRSRPLFLSALPFLQSSARFSDTGTSVVLIFDMDTDYGASAGLQGYFDCPLLLSYPGVSDSDLCSWTSGPCSSESGLLPKCVFQS